MSVLLTAGKKSWAKPKSAKPKKKKTVQQPQSFNATPPMSSEKTAVWHWCLHEVPVTVMFNKENMEVWCNGEVLETVDGFSENGLSGGVTDFYIAIDDSTTHRGRIQLVGGPRSLQYNLVVDGYQIMEHTPTQPMQYIPHPMEQAQAYGGNVPSAAIYDDPPPNYDIVMQDKKMK